MLQVFWPQLLLTGNHHLSVHHANILYCLCLSSQIAMTESAQNSWCNFTVEGLCASHFDRAKCLLFWARRALCSSAALLGLLSSLGSTALELGTRDVHCLSPPLRGEARCEGEISREDTAEGRGRASRSPVLTSKCRFPLIYFSPFFPASRGATVTLGWFHRVPCCGIAASWKWPVDA